MSPKIPKIDSHSGLDFISSIQTSWLVEGSQPTDPLIFLVLQTLTFTAPALGTTHMAHPSQHLLRCVYVVHKGNVEVVEVSMLLVCWAPIMEMFVEASFCFLSSDCIYYFEHFWMIFMAMVIHKMHLRIIF